MGQRQRKREAKFLGVIREKLTWATGPVPVEHKELKCKDASVNCTDPKVDIR